MNRNRNTRLKHKRINAVLGQVQLNISVAEVFSVYTTSRYNKPTSYE